VNLDSNSTLPKWIPQSYIWLDYPRFKSEGAIEVIDQKVKAAGGITGIENIEDRANRLKRLRNSQNEREEFLRSQEAIQFALTEMTSIINKLKSLKPLIEDPKTHLFLSSEERDNSPMFELGFRNYFLCFNNSSSFESGVEFGKLKVSLYEKRGDRGLDYKEITHKNIELKFDRNLNGNIGWSDSQQTSNFYTSEDLIYKWMKDFMDYIELKRKR
jgi:hypothetical protein